MSCFLAFEPIILPYKNDATKKTICHYIFETLPNIIFYREDKTVLANEKQISSITNFPINDSSEIPYLKSIKLYNAIESINAKPSIFSLMFNLKNKQSPFPPFINKHLPKFIIAEIKSALQEQEAFVLQELHLAFLKLGKNIYFHSTWNSILINDDDLQTQRPHTDFTPPPSLRPLVISCLSSVQLNRPTKFWSKSGSLLTKPYKICCFNATNQIHQGLTGPKGGVMFCVFEPIGQMFYPDSKPKGERLPTQNIE